MNPTPDMLPLPDRNPVDAAVAGRLITTQFPQWTHLELRPVHSQGWDNRTFRLGHDMLVRLPTAKEYALAVDKEHRWLPALAPALPLPIPVPLAKGAPDETFPHPWSVYRWLDGQPADNATIPDLTAFAVDLAGFLQSLQQIDPSDGPAPGLHNWYRGGPLSTYDGWAQNSLHTLRGHIPTTAAQKTWEQALATPWDGRHRWFHGDIASGNLLTKDGTLAAVIDFGTCGTGDPACDLAVAWTMLTGRSHAAFRNALDVDQQTWQRGKGWALWKTLVVCAAAVRHGDELPTPERFILQEILDAD